MSNIVLYGIDFSPCVRAAKLTLKALEVDYEYKEVNLTGGEHLSEKYLKMNPQHTVPILDDNGTIIWDSHAVITYLIDKYAKSDELYPKDLVKRAVINQRLFFDAGILFPVLGNISASYWRTGTTIVPQAKLDAIHGALEMTETFLSQNTYIVGESLTVADLSCATTISCVPLAVDMDPAKYPKITAWLERLKTELPYFEEINNVPAKNYCAFLRSKWTQLGD